MALLHSLKTQTLCDNPGCCCCCKALSSFYIVVNSSLREQSRVHSVVGGRRRLRLVPRILLKRRHLLSAVHRQRLDVLRVALVHVRRVEVRALVVTETASVMTLRRGWQRPATRRHGRAARRHVGVRGDAPAAAAARGHVTRGTWGRLRHGCVVGRHPTVAAVGMLVLRGSTSTAAGGAVRAVVVLLYAVPPSSG